MPDIANALKFQRKLTEIEKKYLREIEVARIQTRRALLDILDRQGVTRPAVSAMQREVETLQSTVANLGRVASRDIRNTVGNYTRKQVQLARRVGLTQMNDIGALVAKGAGQAIDGEESFMTSTPAWINQLQTRLEAASAQLRISQAAPDEIRNRLVSEDLSDGRASIWAATGVAAGLEETRDVWTYGVGLLGAYMFFFNDGEKETGTQYQKQAIATIDDRTTDCCLRVHGQIQPIEEPFKLTGTPRYADEIQDPPFHWYCRTSETLWHEEFEKVGVTTEQMEDAAHAELMARETTGKRVKIYPSHATARRVS